MKKVKITWIGTGSTGVHTYLRVVFNVDGFLGHCFVECTAEKAATLAVEQEIDIPAMLIK